MSEKERYATIGTWLEVFRAEGITLDDLTIRRRLESVKAVAETGRTQVGRLIRNGFYAESDVRKACADLMQVFPQADENNVIYLNGEEYRTVAGWSDTLELSSREKVNNRFRRAEVSGIQGRMAQGNIRRFYSASDFRRCCADIVRNIPQADERGFIEQDGVLYIPRRILSEHLGISESIIERAVQSSQIASIEGLSRQSHLVQFHSEADIRNACRDYLGGVPQADENGIFKIEEEIYRVPGHWAKELGVSGCTVTRRLAKAGVAPTKARLMGGAITNFFSESDVLSVLADLLEMPVVESIESQIEYEGKIYGTAQLFADRYNLSAGYVREFLKQGGVKNMWVRERSGKRNLVYLVCEAEPLFAVYGEGLPQANEGGYFYKGNERYWTVPGWSRAQGIALSESAVWRRMSDKGAAIQARIPNGSTANFYADSDLRRHCSDLIREYPRADENGFLELDGDQYTTVSRLWKILSIDESTIVRRIKRAGLRPIKGRSVTNRVYDYYLISAVRELCVGLTTKRYKK